MLDVEQVEQVEQSQRTFSADQSCMHDQQNTCPHSVAQVPPLSSAKPHGARQSGHCRSGLARADLVRIECVVKELGSTEVTSIPPACCSSETAPKVVKSTGLPSIL